VTFSSFVATVLAWNVLHLGTPEAGWNNDVAGDTFWKTAYVIGGASLVTTPLAVCVWFVLRLVTRKRLD
jgi:hypothetical protein